MPHLRPAIARPGHAGAFEERAEDGVYPHQVKTECSRCVFVRAGSWCVHLQILGRRCFNVPSSGRWKACCEVRWGGTPVRCGLSRC